MFDIERTIRKLPTSRRAGDPTSPKKPPTNLSEHQKRPFPCITPLYFVLYAVSALHLSRGLYKSNLFMQNKPNFQKPEIGLTPYTTRRYEENIAHTTPKNEPNTNPIAKKAKMNLNLYNTRNYENKYSSAPHKNEPNSNPKQTQFGLTRI